MKINKQEWKVVLWGYTLHSDTFSYIHNAWERAFKYLGYETYWLNNGSDISNINFERTLFFTEGQVDQNIPMRNDCFYVLHNCNHDKYKHLKNRMVLQVYTDDVLKYGMTKIDDCIYTNGEGLWMPWATDLLPHEIEQNKINALPFNSNSREINWVGTIGEGVFGNVDQINPFKKACQDNGVNFTSTICSKSIEDNAELIRKSYMAPVIVGEWQQRVGYVPCRAFKNLSYGQFIMTNSPRIAELFGNKTIFNTDTYWLFQDAKNRLERMEVSELHNLMDFIRDKHTYMNRIERILSFIDEYY